MDACHQRDCETERGITGANLPDEAAGVDFEGLDQALGVSSVFLRALRAETGRGRDDREDERGNETQSCGSTDGALGARPRSSV